MVWYIIAGIMFALAMLLLVYRYMMDRKLEKANSYDVMADDLREDLDDEVENAYARREMFHKAMEDASKERK